MHKHSEKEIREIMKTMDCQKGFSCHKTGFRNVCKAKSFGVESVIECLEDDPRNCDFAHPYGHLYFCRCPLRNYIEERFGSESGAARWKSG